jgi:transposase
MRNFCLTPTQRATLWQSAKVSPDRREVRRALALLDLDRGAAVMDIACRYGVSRETVYRWAARLRRRPAGCLRDAPRSGRPADQGRAAEGLLRAALPADPRRYGYRHPAWTVPLLHQHLRRLGLDGSEATVRRALRRLGRRWKRPRHVLSRRDPHWRQAKGGSSAG